MSGEGPPRDVRARGAKPRLEEHGRARGREADTRTTRTAERANEAEAHCAPSGGSADAKRQGWGDHS